MQLLLGCCYGVTQGSVLLHRKAYTFCLLDRSRFSDLLAMLSLLAGIVHKGGSGNNNSSQPL